MALLEMESVLTGTLIHPDGSHRDLGVMGSDTLHLRRWEEEYRKLRPYLPLGMTFTAFLGACLSGHPLWGVAAMGIVTTAGVNYLAADWLTTSSNHISDFRYHDSGTGTTPAAVSQTALVSPVGHARVEGVQSNPAANQVRSVATVTYSGAAAVTEWGLFSASSGGTLWDRKVFSVKSVVEGSQITFNYVLRVNAGG